MDDTVYGGSSDEVCDEFYRRMVQHFGECVGNTRAEFVLGLKVTWDLEKKTCTLSQRAHCEKILKEFGMEPNEVRRTETPLPTGLKAEKNDGERVPTQEFDYFGCVGSLNWLAVQTRPCWQRRNARAIFAEPWTTTCGYGTTRASIHCNTYGRRTGISR